MIIIITTIQNIINSALFAFDIYSPYDNKAADI